MLVAKAYKESVVDKPLVFLLHSTQITSTQQACYSCPKNKLSKYETHG